jgi:hypothetical protein
MGKNSINSRVNAGWIEMNPVIRYLVYSVVYSVVPINPSLLPLKYITQLLQHSFIKTQNTFNYFKPRSTVIGF